MHLEIERKNMINIKEKERTIKDKVLESIECDICHKTYPNKTSEDQMEIKEFHLIRFTGGYGSVFGDENQVECDICQHCLKKMIGLFCNYPQMVNEIEARKREIN